MVLRLRLPISTTTTNDDYWIWRQGWWWLLLWKWGWCDDNDWNLGKIRFLFIIGDGYELWDGIPLSPLCLLGKLREGAKRGGWHSKNGSSLLPFCCSLPCFKIQFCQGILDTHWFKIIVAKPRFLQLARTSHETISLPRPKVLETWSQLFKRWIALSIG